MIPYMTIAGKNLLTEYSTFVDFSQAFGNPEHDYEFVEVMGLNGSLTYDNKRFRDKEINFPAFIMDEFIPKYRSLASYMNSLTGYQKMEISHEPDHFRQALFLGSMDPETTQFIRDGRFILPFRVKPERWLKIGQEPVEVTTALLNPTRQHSKPLLRIYGTGTVEINDFTITVAAHSYAYIDVDCARMSAQYELNNANQYVTFNTNDFITLKPGGNAFSMTVTKLEVTPRWFEI